MSADAMLRPALPAAWCQPTLGGFALYLIFSAAWLPVFGGLAWAIAQSALPLWIQLPLLLPSIALAGHGFHLLGWFAHDGIHLSLLRDRHWSMAIGCAAAGAALFPVVGYAITHWNHHRFTNQESDPDTAIYPRHHGFWSRAALGRISANRGYLRSTLRLALGLPLECGYRMPLGEGWTRAFALFSLLCIGAWLALYVWISRAQPGYFAVGLLLPYLSAIPTTGLRIYLEHAGTGAGVFRDTRSYVSPLWTFLMFGNNYHLEHHLYPRVPAYHLGKVHRLLREQGLYQRWDSHVVSGFWEPLRFLSSRYPYPRALLADLDRDPFTAAESGGAAAERAPQASAALAAADAAAPELAR